MLQARRRRSGGRGWFGVDWLSSASRGIGLTSTAPRPCQHEVDLSPAALRADQPLVPVENGHVQLRSAQPSRRGRARGGRKALHHTTILDETGRFPPSDAAGKEPQRGVQDVRVRLPKPLLHKIEALIGLRYADRGEAIRNLLHTALRAEGGER